MNDLIWKKDCKFFYYHGNICKTYIYCYILDGFIIIFKCWFFFFNYFIKCKILSNFWYCFFAMSICASSSLTKGEYSIFFIVTAFSGKSSKTTLPAKNLNLLTFPYDKAEISAVCLAKFYWGLFCSIFYGFDFFTNAHFIISSF